MFYKSIRKKTLSIFSNGIMIIVSLICLYPVFWMITSSFKTETEFLMNPLALPTSLQLDNFLRAIEVGRMHEFFMNSVFNSVTSVTLIVILSFVTGYILSRFEFRGKRLIYAGLMSSLLIPPMALLIPIFSMFSDLGLLDGRFTLLIPYIAFGLPIPIYLISSYIKAIPNELEEAASIDGSGFIRTMFTIIMPITKPVIATTIVLGFLNTWNEFPFALVLVRSDALRTIPLGLNNFIGVYHRDFTGNVAALTIAVLPVLIVYSIFSGKIIRGMASGAVKG